MRLEERRHGARVVAGIGERLQADAVGVALEFARVGKLRRGRARLHRGRRAAREIGPRAPEQHRRGEGGEHGQLHLLLLPEHAGDVTLRHVRNLVREHRSELRLGLRGLQQAGVHADEAAGKRERVDRHVAHAEELEIVPRAGHGLGEARAQRSQVLGKLRVVDELRIAAHLAHDALAEAALDLRRERGIGCATEIGQRRTAPRRAARGLSARP